MNTSTLITEDAPVLREEPALPKTQRPEDARYPVPLGTPEFTHLLMKCFTRARDKAIDELEQMKASGIIKDDQ